MPIIKATVEFKNNYPKLFKALEDDLIYMHECYYIGRVSNKVQQVLGTLNLDEKVIEDFLTLAPIPRFYDTW